MDPNVYIVVGAILIGVVTLIIWHRNRVKEQRNEDE